MPFDLKIGLFPNTDELILRNTNIHIHHTMTFPASEMVMVLLPTGAVGMASIRKFNPVQQPHFNQNLDSPKNCGAAHARLESLQVVPKVFHAKIVTTRGQFRQPGSYPLPGLCFPPSLFFEGNPDFFS